MTAYTSLSQTELQAELQAQQAAFAAHKAKGLMLNMARGKPSPEQLDLSMGLLGPLGDGEDYAAEDGTDVRNYGNLQGLTEARRMMSEVIDADPENIIITGESSLTAEYDLLASYLLFGTGGEAPWSTQGQLKWLCPVPGYDRHFGMTQAFGFELIPVPMTAEGPDMDAVERLVQDPQVKGIWCVPQYANPNGCVYSDDVVRRLATMNCAASDFKIFWDNAYAVHHLNAASAKKVADIGAACEAAGNPSRYVKFASTSKITFPGSGVAAVAAAQETVAEMLSHMKWQAIDHNKVNQLRHVRFMEAEGGVAAHMAKHAALLAPKFACVDEALQAGLDEAGVATRSKPEGGYFVFVRVMEGTAKRVVALCKEAGVTLTAAGCTWPYGTDPHDADIRLAPSYPTLQELKQAMEVFVTCVKLAAAEKLATAGE